MERVTTLVGKEPILIIAPHGFDDTNTGVMAESAAKALKAYAVINHGWERADAVDALDDKANCNNNKHILEDVVKEEFLDPITKYTNKIMHGGNPSHWSNHSETVHVFILHGCGNDVRKAVDPNLSCVVGYGLGDPKPRLTAEEWRVKLFNYAIDQDKAWKFYNAPAGSRFSGYDLNNLNQHWRRQGYRDVVQSMQLEFVTATRKSQADAEVSGVYLAKMIKSYMKLGGSGDVAVNHGNTLRYV
jgi:hypothetical protein